MLLADEESLALHEALGFGYAEHLLISAWRRIASGRNTCPLLIREFSEACGEDGLEALATFVTFLNALAYASRRRLSVGLPGGMALTADERQVLTLIAAAQNDRPALFQAHLSWLARGDARPTLAIGARALAAALNAHALRLTLPALRAPVECARAIPAG